MNSEKNPLGRELLLLLMGAIISAVSVLITDSLNEKRLENQLTSQAKLTFNDNLSADLGKRFYLTFYLYQTKRDKKYDSTAIKAAMLQYRQVKEDWNIRKYSYESLLRFYYGEGIMLRFNEYIYNPLVDFGQGAEYEATNPNYLKQYQAIGDSIISFTSDIYKSIQDNSK